MIYLKSTVMIAFIFSYINSLAETFNAYRIFYHQDSNISLARQFIQDRISLKDSKIFIVKNQENCVVGFIQLYSALSNIFICIYQ
ncbi:hypothetical protein SAMN05421733_102288 [Acinetobacter boissieri]|uniref:Acetyltransferase (GNAT) domain-containing protein n=1 Tax=Acinetobacter boissieri TaxID=1219383 RepID=A0A1G6GVA6_9GAMM|nr:hypothetical protein SAMN05421733_102288 [Acinetobacter boissieri]